MDWVHCNSCYATLSRPEELPTFSVTNCGHVFCPDCQVRITGTGQCLVCGQKCKITLIKTLPPPLVTLFIDNSPSIQKAEEELAKFMKAKKFQDSQRKSLFDHLKSAKASGNGRPSENRSSSTDAVRKAVERAREEDAKMIAKLQKELARLQAMIKSQNTNDHHSTIEGRNGYHQQHQTSRNNNHTPSSILSGNMASGQRSIVGGSGSSVYAVSRVGENTKQAPRPSATVIHAATSRTNLPNSSIGVYSAHRLHSAAPQPMPRGTARTTVGFPISSAASMTSLNSNGSSRLVQGPVYRQSNAIVAKRHRP